MIRPLLIVGLLCSISVSAKAERAERESHPHSSSEAPTPRAPQGSNLGPRLNTGGVQDYSVPKTQEAASPREEGAAEPCKVGPDGKCP
jgi:hypothetical protein